MIKYGVISKRRLIRDLLEWSDLYISGRMHKPIHSLTTDEHVEAAQSSNVESAVRTALLLLPTRFTRLELFRTICMLSYSGDVRMKLAEDARKVDRIVHGALSRSLPQQSGFGCCLVCVDVDTFYLKNRITYTMQCNSFFW